MARYTGPKWKLARRENFDVFGSDKWRRRQTLPGVHPVSKSRASNYSVQFREKQKVKRIYGLLEKQFRNTFKKASKETGNTGLRLLQLLELRLDNVVYKLGFAYSINHARQLVSHGHIKVNGKKITVPSYSVKVREAVEMDEKTKAADTTKILLSEIKKTRQVPVWLENNKVKMAPTPGMGGPGIKKKKNISFYLH